MKKIIGSAFFISSAFVALASAQSVQFLNNLQVGSTGSDVTQLQTMLIAGGFHIPAIESGVSAKGTFGGQTKAAVKLYQAAHGISITGNVGPLTRAALNTAAVATVTFGSASTAPVMNATAPAATPVAVTAAVANTPGVAGTLAITLWSNPSGVTAFKGQAYDIAAYKLQAGSSDMSVSSFTLDFDARLWLYANTITVKDETGAVVGTLSNLSASNFVELTVGSDYRVSVPMNLVVKSTQSKYLTVNVAFNAVSDRSTGTVNVLQAQVRSVDGSGVSDTETASTARSFTYNGSTIGTVILTTSPKMPPSAPIGLSNSLITKGTVLATYSLKSTGEQSTLRQLTVNLSISGNGGSTGTLTNMFPSVSLKVGDTVIGNGSIGSVAGAAGGYQIAPVTFTNLSINMPADTYVDVTVLADAAASPSSQFEGIVASTSIDFTNAANVDVEDAAFNRLSPVSATAASNQMEYTDSTINLGGLPTVTYGSLTVGTNRQAAQTFTYTFPLMAGNNPIYISKNVYAALGTSTNPVGFTISSQDFSDDNTSGDTSTYFYLAPGQIKTIKATYLATGQVGAAGFLKLTLLVYGTDTTATGRYLVSPDVTNILTADLFH